MEHKAFHAFAPAYLFGLYKYAYLVYNKHPGSFYFLHNMHFFEPRMWSPTHNSFYNQQKFISHIFGVWEVQVQDTSMVSSGEDPLPGS